MDHEVSKAGAARRGGDSSRDLIRDSIMKGHVSKDHVPPVDLTAATGNDQSIAAMAKRPGGAPSAG